MTPLILTKVRLPRQRFDLIDRPHLLALLRSYGQCRLVLVIAPAGYGKTTLLARYAAQAESPICWYSIDAQDSDPVVFLNYLIAAVRQHIPTFGKQTDTALQHLDLSTRKESLLAVATAFVNELIEEIPGSLTIMLNDYHLIEQAPDIHQLMEFLLHHLPPHVQMVLASRNQPPFDLAHLVAAREVGWVEVEDMRLRDEELLALLQQERPHLTLEDARKINTQFDGWITGILLGARVGLPVVPLPQRPSASNRETQLFSYFASEVLEREPSHIQEFLLGSSIFERLSPGICDALLERQDSATILESLERKNLFITLMGGDSLWYRYHALFANFLRTRLQAQDKERWLRLHRRAAIVLQAGGERESAIPHLLTAQEYMQAADIIEDIAPQALADGRTQTVAGWLRDIPTEIIQRRMPLLYISAKVSQNLGDWDEAEHLLGRAEELCRQTQDNIGLARILTSQATLQCRKGQHQHAIELCKNAVHYVGNLSQEHHFEALLALADAYYMQGNFALGIRALEPSLGILQTSALPAQAAHGATVLGNGYLFLGEYKRAAYYLDLAYTSWRQIGYRVALLMTIASQSILDHRQSRFQEGLDRLEKALSMAQDVGNIRSLGFITSTMADILLDLNRIEEATKLLERALPCAAQAHDIYLLNCCRSSLAVSYSLLGQHAEAERLAHQGLAEGLTQPQGFDIGLLLLALGQAEWRYGNFELAYQHLSQAERRFRTSGVAWEHSRTLLYLAATQRSMKDQKGALRRLWQALRKIQEKGHQVILKAEEHRLTDLFQLGISHAENHPLHHLLIASKASTADYRTDLHHTHQQPETPPSISSLTIYPVADWEDEEPGGESPQQASSARDYLPAESSDLLALTPSPPLRMEARAFGQPQVIINGQPITHWRTTKALELFFFLLAHNRAAHREAIIEALWPDLPMGRVDSTFRSATYWLRRAIGEEGLLRTSTWYRLNPGWWSDVAEFESLLARAAEAYRGQQIDETRACYKQAFSLYVGHYLEPIYSDWAERRRDELRSLYLEALNRAALLEEHEGAINEAQTLWKRALKIDPCAEEAHRGLIRCYIRSSNRAAAIRQYHNCIRLLKEQLGVDPAPKTVALYAILSGEQQ